MVSQLKILLGEILVEKGFITSDQLDLAIHEQKVYRQRPGAANQITRLKTLPDILKVACAREIRQVHSQNPHQFALHDCSSNNPDHNINNIIGHTQFSKLSDKK